MSACTSVSLVFLWRALINAMVSQTALPNPYCSRLIQWPTRRLRHNSRTWIAPSQTGEAREIMIGRHKLTAMLDGERGEIRIRDHHAPDVGASAEVNKDIPMSSS